MNSTAATTQYQKYGVRWIVLLAFAFITVMSQINWITFAPIMNDVAKHYNVTADLILLLTASYMIFYIPVNFPATWALDKYGLKWGTGIGVILTGVFGLVRGLAGNNFLIIAIAQVMMAIGQPFLLNSFSKLAVTWFPENEKATATGLGTLSIMLGIMIGMALTPILYAAKGINFVLQIYGWLSIIALVLYLVVVKNTPPTPPNSQASEKVFSFKGMKGLFSNYNFNLLLIIIFIGLGAFNAISSEIDNIFLRFTSPEGASGYIGGIMILGGLIGAGIISVISDKTGKRKLFLILAPLISIFASYLFVVVDNFTAIMTISFFFGFFLVSALPVALIYAAEITYPVSEEASNGLMMTAGQISGLLFLIQFNMYFITVIFIIATIVAVLLKEE